MLAWRLRHVAAATCLALATSLTVGALRPAPPPGIDLVVAARDLPAGTVLTVVDLATVTVPRSLAVEPARASDDTRAALLGATIAVAAPAGLPLVPSLLSGGALAGPPGTVVAAVHLGDGSLAALLAPGEHVDLLTSPGDGGPGVVVAHRAVVLPSPVPDPGLSSGSGFGSGSGSGFGSGSAPPLLVAVAPDEAAALAGAATDALFAVVVP